MGGQQPLLPDRLGQAAKSGEGARPTQLTGSSMKYVSPLGDEMDVLYMRFWKAELAVF